MKVISVKTKKVRPGDNLFELLDSSLPRLKDRSVVAVTSKVVSLCENEAVSVEGTDKDRLVIKEAEQYLPRSSSRYNVLLTVKGNAINFSSGVDESNTGGYYVLWPKDPQKSANAIREHLVRKHKKRSIGVVITDTASVPLRWGQRGVFVLAHSGFAALNSYIGKPDIFGRKLKMTSSAVADALGTSAVLVMGEGAEQTPLAVIEDVPFVAFQNRNPTAKELKQLEMSLEDDLYAPLLKAVKWKKGGALRPSMKRRALVFGIFDRVHEGHRSLFAQAKERARELIAVVGRDEASLKWKNKRPRHAQEERRRAVEREELVDGAVLGDKEQSTYTVVQELDPDIICLGYDQDALKEDLEAWMVKTGRNIPVCVMKPFHPELYHNSIAPEKC